MIYKLKNKEGCLFDTVHAKSFKEARSAFKDFYKGSFVIWCSDGEWINVRL